MDGEGISLVDVIHMMLYHRILPLQIQAVPMWDFKPEDEVVVREFFRGEDLSGMWKLLFKPKKNYFPARAEDIGLSHAIPISEVWCVRAEKMKSPGPRR